MTLIEGDNVTNLPEGAYPGPDDTFFCPLRVVDERMEFRLFTSGRWLGVDKKHLYLDNTVVQARYIPLNPPAGIELDEALVTTWGKMKDRRDLDQWEAARMGPSWAGWWPCEEISRAIPDDFPMIVRMKATTTKVQNTTQKEAVTVTMIPADEIRAGDILLYADRPVRVERVTSIKVTPAVRQTTEKTIKATIDNGSTVPYESSEHVRLLYREK